MKSVCVPRWLVVVHFIILQIVVIRVLFFIFNRIIIIIMPTRCCYI